MVAGSYYHYLNFLGYDGKSCFFAFNFFLCLFFFSSIFFWGEGNRPCAGVGGVNKEYLVPDGASCNRCHHYEQITLVFDPLLF